MAKETNIEAVIREGAGKSAVKKIMAVGKNSLQFYMALMKNQ